MVKGVFIQCFFCVFTYEAETMTVRIIVSWMLNKETTTKQCVDEGKLRVAQRKMQRYNVRYNLGKVMNRSGTDRDERHYIYVQ